MVTPRAPVRHAQCFSSEDDQRSILSLYRRLIELRRRDSALSLGSLRAVETHNDVLTYHRKHGSEMVVIMLNFSNDQRIVARPNSPQAPHLLFSTTRDRQEEFEGETILLGPNEGLMLLCETASTAVTD